MGATRALVVALATALLPATLAHYVEQPTCPYPVRPFEYVGCFQESDPNTLSFRSNANMYNMTVEQCWNICKGNDFKYAGLEYYGICFCGNAVMGPQASESECNYGCSGDNTQTCGGDNRISVYKDTTWPELDTTDTSDYASLGCRYDNSPTGRALTYPASKYFGSGMTTEVCLAACKAGGYPYAGTQYSSECWCGLTLGPDAYSTPNDCQMPCAGNSSEICGGPSRLSVYYASDMQSGEPCGSYAAPQLAPSDTASASTIATASAVTVSEDAVATPYTQVSSTSTQDLSTSATDAVSSDATTVVADSAATSSSTTDAVVATPAAVSSSSDTDASTTSTSSTTSSADAAATPKLLPVGDSSTSSTTSSSSSTSSSISLTSSFVSTTSTQSTSASTSSSSSSTSSSTSSSSSSSSSSTTSSSSSSQLTTLSTSTSSSTTSARSTTSSSTVSSTTSKPPTTTAPTTTSKASTTSSTSSICYATSTVASTCEYKCGSWCSDSLDDFDNQSDCQSAVSSCKIQIASCFANAGWPGALDCFSFSSWCSNIASYCTSKSSVSKDDLFSRNGPNGVPASTTKVVVPCAAAGATSTKKPTTTSTANPTKATIPASATNICKQPSDRTYGYAPGNPVGGIDLPVLTCNDYKSDWISRPFKLYTSSQGQTYSRSSVPTACADACKAQYNQCISVYAESCRQPASGGGSGSFWDIFFGSGGRFRRSSALERRTSGWSDNYSGATNKCKAQYSDCQDENRYTSGNGKCGLWGLGW